MANNNHPDITYYEYTQWSKWRLAYDGGRRFIENYLEKFSEKELNADFNRRCGMTYYPNFAKSAIQQVINRLVTSFPQIQRMGNCSYIPASDGLQSGVDSKSHSMDVFLTNNILPELLVMGAVGTYVDMTDTPPSNAAQAAWPYFYNYTREQIRNWRYEGSTLVAVHLTEYDYVYDDRGFPTAKEERHRYLTLTDSGVRVVLARDAEAEEIIADTTLELDQIPFVTFELSHSLMLDLADYSVAMLNMASSDVSYILNSNYPFLTMQEDLDTKLAMLLASRVDDEGNEVLDHETREQIQKAVGTYRGMTYGKNLDRPDFIAPPVAPLQASMEKQAKMVEEIHMLLNRSLTSLKSVSASTDVLNSSEETGDAGLYVIGETLSNGEQQLADIWCSYTDETPPTIIYPTSYGPVRELDLETIVSRYSKTITVLPSHTYQKEVAKKLAATVLNDVDQETLTKISKEIDNAPNLSSDPETVRADVEAGLVSRDLASELRGYPEGEVDVAKQEHAERLALIAKSQSVGIVPVAQARGVDDLSGNSEDGKDEKTISQDRDQSADQTKPVRGKAK